MSDALATLRAIDAIPARLADRMAEALVNVTYFDRLGARLLAYERAGIRRDEYPDVEWYAADGEAHSIELARRFP